VAVLADPPLPPAVLLSPAALALAPAMPATGTPLAPAAKAAPPASTGAPAAPAAALDVEAGAPLEQALVKPTTSRPLSRQLGTTRIISPSKGPAGRNLAAPRTPPPQLRDRTLSACGAACPKRAAGSVRLWASG